ELLDMGIGDPADVAASMRDLHRINTLLGGTWSVTRHLYPRVRRLAHPPTVLEVGAGDGVLAHRLAGWRTVGNAPVRVLASDLTTTHLHLMDRNNEAVRLQSDALAPPVAPGSVDYAVSSLLLHHFRPSQIVLVLRALWHVVRCGIVMSDLVRGRLPELAWHLARPVLARSWITYHDGLISVQRSYTPTELLRLADLAGIPNARVIAQFPWRMTLTADKPS
ncbi:MAG: methyltransferase domain-containing protein, partial [Chloroflexota bacterium]